MAKELELPHEGKSVEAYWAGVGQDFEDQLLADGNDKYTSQLLANKLLTKAKSAYSKLTTAQRKVFLLENPDVARALIDAGYDVQEAGYISAAGATP